MLQGAWYDETFNCISTYRWKLSGGTFTSDCSGLISTRKSFTALEQQARWVKEGGLATGSLLMFLLIFLSKVFQM